MNAVFRWSPHTYSRTLHLLNSEHTISNLVVGPRGNVQHLWSFLWARDFEYSLFKFNEALIFFIVRYDFSCLSDYILRIHNITVIVWWLAGSLGLWNQVDLLPLSERVGRPSDVMESSASILTRNALSCASKGISKMIRCWLSYIYTLTRLWTEDVRRSRTPFEVLKLLDPFRGQNQSILSVAWIQIIIIFSEIPFNCLSCYGKEIHLHWALPD